MGERLKDEENTIGFNQKQEDGEGAESTTGTMAQDGEDELNCSD